MKLSHLIGIIFATLLIAGGVYSQSVTGVPSSNGSPRQTATGAAGGDLSGTYPNPNVVGLGGGDATYTAVSHLLQMPSNGIFRFSTDAGISRDATGIIDVGNGTAGDYSGTLKATILKAQVQGQPTYNSTLSAAFNGNYAGTISSNGTDLIAWNQVGTQMFFEATSYCFGGVSCFGSSVTPSIVVSGSALKFRNGTNAADAPISASNYQLGTPVAVASLAACASGTLGGRVLVNNATVATPGSAAVGGGTFTIAVECTFNSTGSVYTWIID